jgi:hypothetical protein
LKISHQKELLATAIIKSIYLFAGLAKQELCLQVGFQAGDWEPVK